MKIFSLSLGTLTFTPITIPVVGVIGIITILVIKYIIEAVNEASQESIDSKAYQRGGS